MDKCLLLTNRIMDLRKYECHIIPVCGKSYLIKPLVMAKLLNKKFLLYVLLIKIKLKMNLEMIRRHLDTAYHHYGRSGDLKKNQLAIAGKIDIKFRQPFDIIINTNTKFKTKKSR